MEARTTYAIALTALTVLVFGLRLLVSFQVVQPGYESYFTLLQADTIRESALPRTHDPFSFGGRHYLILPLFYYLIALCTLALPELLVLKVLPNLLMAALVPLTYLIAHNLSRNRWVSIIAAFFAGFSPLLFTTGINNATPVTLAQIKGHAELGQMALVRQSRLSVMPVSAKEFRTLVSLGKRRS